MRWYSLFFLCHASLPPRFYRQYYTSFSQKRKPEISASNASYALQQNIPVILIYASLEEKENFYYIALQNALTAAHLYIILAKKKARKRPENTIQNVKQAEKKAHQLKDEPAGHVSVFSYPSISIPFWKVNTSRQEIIFAH